MIIVLMIINTSQSQSLLVSIKMSERRRKSISIKSKYEILMKLKSGMKRDLIISEYN